jgi:hypothetical protein
VIEYGNALGCDTVHLMAGVVGPGKDYKAAEHTYISNLRLAAAVLGEHGIAGVIEPINKKMDIVQNGPSYTTQGMHGYFLNHTDQARRILGEVGSPNLLLHLDCYHMQMLEGHPRDHPRKLGGAWHVQIAGFRSPRTDGRGNQLSLFVGPADELGQMGRLQYRPGRYLDRPIVGFKVRDPRCKTRSVEVSTDHLWLQAIKKEGRSCAPRKPRNSRGGESYVGEDRFPCCSRLSFRFRACP